MTDITARRLKDAEAYDKVDGDLCMLCHAYGADKRSWYSRCFYDLKEVLPEALDLYAADVPDGLREAFYLRICKSCRAEYLELLANWRKSRIARRTITKNHDGHELDDADSERNIPVRIHGVTKMVTMDEYNILRETRQI